MGIIVETRNLESGEHVKRVKSFTRILGEQMKQHTVLGCEFFKDVEEMCDEEYARCSYEICRHHHERYDGRGYPDGLKGDEIPISAQLVSVADVYDALVNKRCYKEAYPKQTAFEMIIRGECGAFSPQILECFRCGIREFEKVAYKQGCESCNQSA